MPDKAPPPAWESCFPLACALFRAGAVEEAYRIFASLQPQQEHPALLVNLALCHMAAAQWQRAVGCLEQALSLLKKMPPEGRPPQDETYRLLEMRAAESDGYRLPLPEHAPACAPGYAKDTVRRLLVDCCAELALWDRVQTLAQAMKPKRYANVERALARAGE